MKKDIHRYLTCFVIGYFFTALTGALWAAACIILVACGADSINLAYGMVNWMNLAWVVGCLCGAFRVRMLKAIDKLLEG